MEFISLTESVRIPKLGLGTWAIGGEQVDLSKDKKIIRAIKKAIRLGYTHIDTAEVYHNGHSEELVGEAMKSFKREKLFITTKVAPEHLHYQDLIDSAKASLARLGTDYLDLYLIHQPNFEVPIAETMQAMDDLVEQKLVKFIGVSNFSVEQMKEAQKHTKNKIAAVQLEYNLLVRNQGRFSNNMEKEIIPYCQENNILIIVWRPLAKGILAQKGLPILDRIAKKNNKTRAQVALNWLLSKKGIVAIFQSTNYQHLVDNLGALGWKLSPKELGELDQWKM